MRKIMTRLDRLGRRFLAVLPAAGFGVALAGSVVLAPAHAAEEDGDMLRGVLSAFGLVDEAKPQIQYRERAPLVVPPSGIAASGTLPPPKEGAEATNPNWPKDPDLQRARAASAEDRSPVGVYGIDQRGQPLLPSQLNNVKHKPTSSVANGPPVGANGSVRDELMPSELGFTGWFKGLNGGFVQDKPLTFTGEPTRESLIDPPPGYQTPAPNAPYGTVEKKEEAFKLPSFFDLQNTSTKN